MASTKPEGLSPCFGSFVSPDILSSYKFRWQPPSTQSSYTITLYSSDSTTVLKTYNGTGASTELPASSIGYTFTNGSTYYWNISVNGGNKSAKAKFIYKNKPQRPSISWTSTEPKFGDEVVRAGRLQEIKNNILVLLGKYDYVDSSIQTKTNNLFTSEIIPYKKDFNDLQTILEWIGNQEGVTYGLNSNGYIEVRTSHGPTRKWDNSSSSFSAYSSTSGIDDTAPILKIPLWVEDGLGVSDLDNVVDYINWLSNRQPEPAKDFSIVMGATPMYQVHNVVPTHSDNRDTTIDISWTIDPMPDTNGTMHFDQLSISKNVWFYEIRFSYGPNGMYRSDMFFDNSILPSGSTITFDAGWATLFTTDTMDTAVQKLEVYTIDHSANISELKTEAKTYDSNFKAPIGFDHYRLQYQKCGLGATAPASSNSWGDVTNINNIDNRAFTYTVSGAEGVYFYRIKAVDKSGLESDWAQSTPITFDPLLPPTAPSAVRVSDSSTSSITWVWNHGVGVEKYRINAYNADFSVYEGEWFVDDWSQGWLPNWSVQGGLGAHTGHNIAIRSENRVGVSDWVWAGGWTKDNVHEKYWNAVGSQSWRDNWGWRTDKTEWNRVYQGEWCELPGTRQAGTCWGKNKGLWYFDYSDIRSTLAGKSILEVKLWVNRSDTYHGYYSDQVIHMWTHNYGWPGSHHKAGDGEPYLANHTEIRNPTFAKGESAWVTLDNSYGEKLRDGSAAGFALYVPDWGRSPYVYCEGNAQLYIKYQG